MPSIDVVLFSRSCLRGRSSLVEQNPPLSKAIEVSPGIWLAAVKDNVAHVVFHACKFRELDHRGNEVLYGFTRYDPPGDHWDADGAISKALYLSHFIRAHEGGFEFAARLITDDKNRIVDLGRADIIPTYIRAYPAVGEDRRWLTQSEGELLAQLIPAYDASRGSLAGKRLGMAVSLFADIPFIYHGRARATALVSILEGLVSTRPDRAAKQFNVRVPALASELGLTAFNAAWARKLYALRSRLAHGDPLFHSPETREETTREVNQAMLDTEKLLRALLVKSLTDRAFADRVNDADTHWPVAGKGCAACRAADPSLNFVYCPACNRQWV